MRYIQLPFSDSSSLSNTKFPPDHNNLARLITKPSVCEYLLSNFIHQFILKRFYNKDN